MDNYCKVLIVDDEMLVRQGIKHLFEWESEGFVIAGEASNGREAMEKIAELKPHIIITDIVMPIMDGEELARKVKADYPEIEIIVLSSFGEFEYVRSTFQSGAVDYILKPKLEADKLLDILKNTARRIPSLQHMESAAKQEFSLQFILDKLIAGYPAEYDPAKVSAILPFPHFALMSINPGHENGLSAHDLKEWCMNELARIQRNSGEKFISCFLSSEGKQVRLLLNVGDEYIDELAHTARLVVTTGAVNNLNIVIALSYVFQDLQLLSEVYTSGIMKLLDNQYFLPGVNPLIWSELSQKAEVASFDNKTFNELLNMQEFHQAFEQVRSYAQSLTGTRGVDVEEFKSFLGHSVFNIILTLQRYQYNAAPLDQRKYEYFRRIHESRDIGEAIQIMDSFLDEADQCVLERMRTHVNPAMNKLLQYIKDHLDEPLSLTEVAKQFHFNPSYLSNYFTMHNDEGFSEYLTRVRIERASELLREGEATISEISSRVGYSDHSYFTKVFRKLKGVSPSQYRREAQEGH
ncbi:response regulator transcription factor [Paenibacillus zeisoli]|nr:response regulator transcription factor [Paenibacillus zeisoli]